MKSVLVLLFTLPAFSAHALESFYGKLSYSKGEYHCTYKNDAHAKYFKYVIFTLQSRSGGDSMAGFNDQQRIDTVIKPNETLVAHSGDSMASIGESCHFVGTK